MDYKTDHVSKQDGADILKKRYKRQLDDYQQALEQMLQKKVRQKLIYSFALKCWIEILRINKQPIAGYIAVYEIK